MTAVLEDVQSELYDAWGTLNTKADPTKLDKAQTPRAINVFPDEKPGSIVTAPGYTHVGDLPSGNPCVFMYTFAKSDGTSIVLVSDNATVWKTSDFTTFTSLITGLSRSYQLRAVTLRDKVWLTNGNDSVRTYDGTTVTVLDGTSSTPNVPKGKFIAVWQERVWLGDIPAKRSSVRFSALTDSSGADIAPDNSAAWPSANELAFGQDDGDVLCGLKVYATVLHIFKAESIYRIDGTDEFSYQPAKTTATTGSRMQESIQERDNLLEFIGRDGVYEFNGATTEKVSDIIESVSLNQFSFANIQQGSNQSQTHVWTSQSDFAAGTLTAVTASRSPGDVIIDSFTYSGDVLPADDDPVWTKTTIRGNSESCGGGILTLTSQGSAIPGAQAAEIVYSISDSTISNTNGTRLSMNCKVSSATSGYLELTISDGTKYAKVLVTSTAVYLGDATTYNLATYTIDMVSAYHIIDLKLQGSTATLYVDGTSRGTCTPSAVGGTHFVEFGLQSSGATLMTGYVDYVSVIFLTTGTAQIISDVYQITSTIATWGAFQATYSNNGGTITFYFRSGTSSANCLAASWAAITPGSTISVSTSNVYVQWRADFVSDGTTNSPILEDVTVGWNTSSASVVTDQPVATIVYKNRYWLSGASSGSSTNDTCVLRGKRLYGTPWIELSGFNLVAFCIFNKQLYAASSTNDDILRLDVNNSLNGSALDSAWETRDEVANVDEPFYKRWPVIIISGVRKGNYNLTVDVSIDGGETFPAGYQKTISLSGTGRFIAELRYPDLRGKQIRVRVRTNGVDTPFEVSSIRVFWRKKFLR